ncbi:GABA permease [Geobacillus sp. BCO2]|nr:GABA permease [Geobacillus sp. BCO2]
MNDSGLQKGLKERHMAMIAIAGVIGAGLFVGSGAVIHSTGPGAVFSYALAGALVVLVMRMLGEMAAARPTSGSFAAYAHEAIGPWAGFTVGWLYWFFWVIVIAIEANAGAAIIQYWFPSIPLWLLSLILTILMTLTNIWSVKSYGEFEYWFAFIKVASIVLFLILGLAFIFGLAPGSDPVGLKKFDWPRRIDAAWHRLHPCWHCHRYFLLLRNRNRHDRRRRISRTARSSIQGN